MAKNRSYIKLDEEVKSLTCIPPNGKILHAEICALSQNDGCCFASNKYFAGELDLSVQSISRLLSLLKKHGLITIAYTVDEKGYRKRLMKPKSSMVFAETRSAPSQKREMLLLKNAMHNTPRRIQKNNTSYESKFTPKFD